MYLTEEEIKADLIRQMPERERKSFGSFGHLRVEAIFKDRVFVVYRSNGKSSAPDILTTIRVQEVHADNEGASTVLIDQGTGDTMRVAYQPERLFHYPIFVSLPLHMRIQFQARTTGESAWIGTLAFALLVKTKNKSDFHSAGNVYVETPNDFKTKFPNITGLTF
jgi:hypothetical protein